MPYIAITVFILIIVAGIFAFYAQKIKKKEFEKTGKHPEGHYLGQGIAYGLPFGFLLAFFIGIYFDNPSFMAIFGPILGMGFGLPIGSYLEKKHSSELRPLSPAELKMKKNLVIFTGLLVALGFIVFALVAFL